MSIARIELQHDCGKDCYQVSDHYINHCLRKCCHGRGGTAASGAVPKPPAPPSATAYKAKAEREAKSLILEAATAAGLAYSLLCEATR